MTPHYDVIVVGFGAAGAAAAIEAADRGARVLVLDRGYGGGATALSGGIVYAGGGTAEQQAGGYNDSVEGMRAYLEQEVGDAVGPETLSRFCEQSAGMIEWLKAQGVEFRGGRVSDYKTSYPTDDFYLYYSGNEKVYPYVEHARPAPRGHRVLAPGMSSGKVLFERLRRSADAKGVDVIPLAKVHELITDGDGRVVGVRYRALARSHPDARKHAAITRVTGKAGTWLPGLVKGAVARAEALWARSAADAEARAESVILAAGGFIYNREWMRHHAPAFMTISPLGTPGDDGGGINRERVLQRAWNRGLVEPGVVPPDDEINMLIFQPGFSTAEQVTNLSGRGVGMDVVKRNIESLRGSIKLNSRPGVGLRLWRIRSAWPGSDEPGAVGPGPHTSPDRPGWPWRPG